MCLFYNKIRNRFRDYLTLRYFLRRIVSELFFPNAKMVNNNKRDNFVCFLPSTKGKVHLSPLVVKHSCKVAEVSDVAADVDIVKDETVVIVGIFVGLDDGTAVAVEVVI